MNIPLADLHRQYLSIKKDIDEAVHAVLDDCAFIGSRSNRHVIEFEAKWAEFVGVSNVVGCGNATDGLQFALEAYGVGPGDEVIVPAMSWVATAGAVARIGAVPVFVDVEPRFHTLDPGLVEAAITERTKAIVPVHLYGLCADMAPILSVARAHNLVVVEDAAQAHGATYHGKNAGTLGDAGVFSFYPGKNLGALGDAGCVVTNDDDVAEQVRRIANHGQVKKHEHYRIGTNSRLDGIHAAVLAAKIPHLAGWNKARSRYAGVLRSALQGLEFSLPEPREDCGHVFHVFGVRTEVRDSLQQFLKELGIGCTIHYPTALSDLAIFENRCRNYQGCPVATELAATELSLPLFAEMREDELTYLVDSVEQFFGNQ